MPLNIFNLPDLTTTLRSARAAMAAALPGSNPWLWPNNANPAAKVVAGVAWSAYQRLDFVGRQTFALFAEGKYLDDHGAELGLPRKLASAPSGNIVVTVTAAAAVASGATFVRGDGVVYAASAAASISAAGSFSVAVTGPAGAAANCEPATPMTIGSGVSGDGASGALAAADGDGLFGGADVEPDGPPQSRDLSTYRGRILFRKANPAQGGSPADYVTWALALAGVTRVFVERRWAGAGSVRVFPLFDELFAGAGGVADSGHIAAVNAVLQTLAPAGCALTVAAPTAFVINVAISGLNPNTAAAQTAVTAELADTFRRLGAVSGSDSAVPGMPYLASPFRFLALYVEQAVANASGVLGADVAATDQAVPAGYVPVLGTVTFS